MRIFHKLSNGLKLIIGFHILNFLVWGIGQGGAVISYDKVAEWGLQDPRILLDPAIVAVNKAIGLADMILLLPLFAGAAVGLLKRKLYGTVLSWMVLGISIYWPIVFLCSQFYYEKSGIQFNPTTISVFAVLIFMILFSSWACCYLFKNFDDVVIDA